MPETFIQLRQANFDAIEIYDENNSRDYVLKGEHKGIYDSSSIVLPNVRTIVPYRGICSRKIDPDDRRNLNDERYDPSEGDERGSPF